MIPGRPPRRAERGQAIVLIALMLAVLIGMVALAIDGARGYALRRDMQAAIDAAALAAGDNLQRGGSYSTAEQAAVTVFASNLRLYPAPSCSAFGSPAGSPVTVTCTFADGTVLAQTVSDLGPQGSAFSLRASRQLRLEFARVLTNGSTPTLFAAGSGSVDNLAYAPAVAALAQSGCAGAGGTALTVNGGGTLNVTGDVVSDGAVSVASGALRVAGDLYARCQSSIAGASTACYPSGASSPCSYPDVAGAVRTGFRLADAGYPAPTQLGGSQGVPGGEVVLPPGIYSSLLSLNNTRCWFLAGGVYDLPAGYSNLGDLVSNELKPPDEASTSNNATRATDQFWNAGGVNCAGSFQLTRQVGGSGSIPTGNWAIVVTSTRADVYGGVAFNRESAPSMCQVVNLNPHFNDVQLAISNVPGATAYNVYAAPPNSGCAGPFGLAMSVPVSGSVLNTNTMPCPAFTGSGCSLGHETVDLGPALQPPFAPNAAAAPGTSGAYPPDPQRPPLAAGLPNQNAARGDGVTGDRANENRCATAGGAGASCPGAVTPGAVELYVPAGGCVTTSGPGNTYVFSGAQYDWISVYEPPANTCIDVLGAGANGAYIGLFYAPGGTIGVTSQHAFDSAGTAGVMGNKVTFSGTLPSITYDAGYAPSPPATRLAA